MPVTLREQNPGVWVLQMDRPEVRNALNRESITAFGKLVERAREMRELRVLVVTGAGSTFIAGGDLKELANYPTFADGARLSGEMTRTLALLEALSCPTIAAINGPARGGGAEIALACDMRIMAQDADLGFVQIQLGLTPGWGGGQRLLRLVGYSRALEWLTMGRILDAEHALMYGLANVIAPQGAALESALEFAGQIAEQPPKAVRAVKRLLRAGLDLPAPAAQRQEQEEFPFLWEDQAHLSAVEEFLRRSEGSK